MKNNLSKTKTVIILFLVTVIFLSFYAFVITRPVSYGLAYHNETVYEGYHFEGKLKFYRDGIMLIENSGLGEPLESYYYYKDGYVVSLMETEEEKRQAEIELIEENIEDYFLFKVNAFVYTSKGINEELPMTYACKSIFVFAVFGGVFALALIALTGWSLVLSAKARLLGSEETSAETTYKSINVNSLYQEQQNLTFTQFLVEVPSFIAVMVAAIFSKTLLVFVDLLDTARNLARAAMATILSPRLSEELRYEYNYGVGKIEALGSLICDGLVTFGLLVTVGFSVYSIIFPDPPSGLVIAVAGLKAINVCVDAALWTKQRKIISTNNSTAAEKNYAALSAELLFDSIILAALLIVWLLRNNPLSGYIVPVISVLVAVYLMIRCIKRAVRMLNELTDKTLPEEMQMKILSIMTRFYDSYSQFHSINSQKSGDITRIDLHLSFEKDTGIKEIVNLKKKMQEEFDRQIGNCIVNIIVSDN